MEFNQDMESRKKFEVNIIYVTIALMVLLFVFTPKYTDGTFSVWLNGFLDNYLFGNGYYKPNAYPFAAKVTNSFSVILFAAVGIWMGIYRRKDVITPIRHPYAGMVLMIFLMLLCFRESMYPQQFSINPPRKSFGLTESFHNNPFLFMMLMFMKNTMIYAGLRVSISFSLFFLANRKKENGMK